ncbi:UNVERIFIED_CONTAM: hypothetical protein Slati_2809800 [Sesamum latifolium]|uniref:Uncharacterized protein n=1 Tax=Sesamum latifolium TaxID=2727402 RepID=A0AAW2VBQ1_9LAMI
MSSATTAVSAADAVTVADTVEKAPRRFPPPCWTQEETLALIEAYRERWYASAGATSARRTGTR